MPVAVSDSITTILSSHMRSIAAWAGNRAEKCRKELMRGITKQTAGRGSETSAVWAIDNQRAGEESGNGRTGTGARESMDDGCRDRRYGRLSRLSGKT